MLTLNNCLFFYSVIKISWVLFLQFLEWVRKNGSSREWALLRCTVTYICANAQFDESTQTFHNERYWNKEKAPCTWCYFFMGSRCLCTGITRPAVKENANHTKEENKKITSSCLLFKNKSDNSIAFYQKSANVYAVPGCCNYPGRF